MTTDSFCGSNSSAHRSAAVYVNVFRPRICAMQLWMTVSHWSLQTVCHEHYSYRTDQRTNVTANNISFDMFYSIRKYASMIDVMRTRGLMSRLQFKGSHRSKRSKTEQFKKFSIPVSYKTHEVTTSTALQAQTESVLSGLYLWMRNH